MKYTIEQSLSNFPAWSYAEEVIIELEKRGDIERVETIINDCFSEELPSVTQINDFLRFETDFIADCLGYDSWELYLETKEVSF